MKIRLVAAMLILGISGCAAAPGPDTDMRGCDAARAQSLVGRPASSAVAAEAQRLTGAGFVRWLQPGQIVTMEYRADRLNLVLDGQNRIEAIRCG